MSAGHRNTYGAPFFALDQLMIGEQFEVTLADGHTLTYAVTANEIVANDAPLPVWATPTLVLEAYHPKYTARETIRVTAFLVTAP